MVFAILGSLGGVAAFLGAMFVVVKAIFKQVRTTEDNTQALIGLRETIGKLDVLVDDHAQRIARLEGAGAASARRPPR